MKYAVLILMVLSRLAFCQNPDYSLLKSINAHNMPCWDKTMRGLSTTVYPLAPLSAAGILAHGYLKKDKVLIRNGYKSAISLSFAMLMSTTLKYIIRRERPYHAHPDIVQRDTPGTYSFPSGHTTAAFATATALSLSYKKWYVAVPAYTYAGFVGYSRMRLGVHYPSDVLGGIVLGIGSGLLTWQIDKWLSRRKPAVSQFEF